MSFDFPDPAQTPPRRPVAIKRRRTVLLPTVGVLIVLVLAFGLFAGFWTDWLWFRTTGYTTVIRTEILTKIGLFLGFGVAFAAVVIGNFAIAYRLRPTYQIPTPDAAVLERYRRSIEPFRRLIMIAGAIVLVLFAGSSASSAWRTWLQWRNRTSFGTKDPQFGLDVSFYVFSLPWWRFMLGFAFAALVVSLVVSLVAHWLYGGLRPQAPSGQRTTAAARVHLSVLLGVFVLLKAVGYWLDRYSLATAGSTVGREEFTGLRYTDVNAVLPGKTILAVIAVICAVLFFATAITRSWLLPGVGVGLLVLSAVLVGGIYPAAVQYFQVRPSEPDREAPYLTNFIAGTRTAYNIADTQVQQYAAKTTATAG
ncbi:MAG TPA: UPF0182 family protein, partial [Actinomycetes bacterium]|nr:UPF0182 family protein [Actinomycetes bacterium]